MTHTALSLKVSNSHFFAIFPAQTNYLTMECTNELLLLLLALHKEFTDMKCLQNSLILWSEARDKCSETDLRYEFMCEGRTIWIQFIVLLWSFTGTEKQKDNRQLLMTEWFVDSGALLMLLFNMWVMRCWKQAYSDRSPQYFMISSATPSNSRMATAAQQPCQALSHNWPCTPSRAFATGLLHTQGLTGLRMGTQRQKTHSHMLSLNFCTISVNEC